MADWMDILEGISGGVSGIPKGLTAGAAPFDIWENVRGKDLASDRNEILLRDLSQTQSALENPALDYYGNLAAAKNMGSRVATAKGESDIFGLNRQLELQQYLMDPEGAFQQGVLQAGMTPGTPEYRKWLAEAISMYDPQGGVKSYDTFGIPQMEQRNVNEQAALELILKRAQEKDPNAQIIRNTDGTISILSNGAVTPIEGKLLAQAAAMLQKGPMDAIQQGLASELAIQRSNADVWEKLNRREITPAAAVGVFRERGVSIRADLGRTIQQYTTLVKSQEYLQALPEEQQAMKAPLVMAINDAQKRLRETEADANRILTGGRVSFGAPQETPRGPAPVGGATVTQQKFAPGIAASRAAGPAAAGAAPPLGAPVREASGPIRGLGATPTGDPLMDFLNGIGIM